MKNCQKLRIAFIIFNECIVSRSTNRCTNIASMRNNYDVSHSTTYGKMFCTFVSIMDVSESSKYRDLLWAIELNRFGLEIVGLWPKINENLKEKFTCALRAGVAFIMITFVTGVPMVWALVRVWGNMMLVIENVQIMLPLLAISLKLPIMWWKRKAVLSIIIMIMEDWMQIKKDAKREVIIRQARIARFIVICEYSTVVLSVVIVIGLPLSGIPFRQLTNLTDRDRVLPLPTYYYYNTDKSPLFELTCASQGLAVFLAILTFASVDSFLVIAIFHICAQLEIFKCGLVNLISCKDFKNILRNCIVTHLRLIKFIGNIEDTYALMMLTVVISFALTFCTFGFLLLTVFEMYDKISNIPISRICYVAIAMTNLLTQMFLYCGAGELLTMQCDAVYRAICDLEWYTLDSKKTRNLMLLMIRSNEPFQITAGKIIPLSMTTFCSLLKTSAGYISFLLTRQR